MKIKRGSRMNRSVKLQTKNLSVSYKIKKDSDERYVALKDINLDIYDQEFICVVGPSGCGKTTLLNAIAGLIPYSSGELFIDGQRVTGPGQKCGVVFQHSSLMPWRTVFKNVTYGLEILRKLTPETKAYCMDLIERVGLKGFENHYPSQLSGGMQQRVNLARALAADPEVLLLDEPFAALDAQTREVMQSELLDIWQRSHKTSFFVTHQINEAIYLADRVVVLSSRPGSIREIIPIEFERPRDLSIKRSAKFLEYEDLIWSYIEHEVRQSTKVGTA